MSGAGGEEGAARSHNRRCDCASCHAARERAAAGHAAAIAAAPWSRASLSCIQAMRGACGRPQPAGGKRRVPRARARCQRSMRQRAAGEAAHRPQARPSPRPRGQLGVYMSSACLGPGGSPVHSLFLAADRSLQSFKLPLGLLRVFTLRYRLGHIITAALRRVQAALLPPRACPCRCAARPAPRPSRPPSPASTMVAAVASGQLLDGVRVPGLDPAPAPAPAPGAKDAEAQWPPLVEPQARAAASSGILKEVLVSGVSVSVANTATNPLGALGRRPGAAARAPRGLPRRACVARCHVSCRHRLLCALRLLTLSTLPLPPPQT